MMTRAEHEASRPPAATTAGARKAVHHNGAVIGWITVTGDFDRDQEAAIQVLKDAGLYREVTPQQAMYRQAMAFGQTALMVNDRLQSGDQHVMWSAPLVVSHAFSMEMMLKALATAHGGKPAHTHNLARLHRQLPAPARKALDASIAKRPAPPGYTLESVLQNLAESFIRWRYFYDMGGDAGRFNIPSAMWAATVLEQACIDSGVKP